VKSAENVRVVRRILSNHPLIKIFAKIENQEGLERIDEILEVADGICLYRGDLMESMAYEKVDAHQRAISEKCNQAGKTIVTASQMLQSMIENMNPTKTEVQEIENAVDYGTDVFMLCSETSTGKNPIRAIATLSALLTEQELKLNYVQTYQKIFLHSWTPNSLHKNDQESIASSAVKTAFEINASIIVVLTQTGAMTRFVAKYRPACSIMSITDNADVARQCLCLRSTFPLLVGSMKGTESLIGRAVEVARDILRIVR
jgi:pyruvate kinase